MVVALVAVPGPAGAATADLFNGFQAKSKDPVQVDAGVLEISEQGKQRISVFKGNVVVRRGKTVLKAAMIKLYSDLKSTTPEGFTRIEASGGVFVSSGEQTVTGKTAVVDMTTHTITVSTAAWFSARAATSSPAAGWWSTSPPAGPASSRTPESRSAESSPPSRPAVGPPGNSPSTT